MNAEVTMPIGDLDKLRNDLKEAQEKVKKLEKTEKQVKLTVTVLGERYNQNFVYGSLTSVASFDVATHYRNRVEEPVYVNMDEVIREIRADEERKVIEQLGNLQRQLREERTNLQNVISDNLSSREELENKYKEAITALEKEIAILKNEKVDLSKDEQIRELKKRIQELTTPVKKENKGFFQRLLNK